MGITIHYAGKLRSREGLAALHAIASQWGARWRCEVVDIDDPAGELIRVHNGQVYRYRGPVAGLAVLPHADAEPFLLQFDADLYMQQSCKTQFAPPQVHVEIIGMLREMAPCFEALTVHDEGGYWETGDRAHLEDRLAECRALIDKIAAHDGALIAPLVEDALSGKDRLRGPRYSPN